MEATNGAKKKEKKKKRPPQPQFVLRGHTAPVVSLCFAPKGQTLVSGSLDGSLMLWDMQTQRCAVHLQRAHEDKGVNTIAFVPEHEHLMWTHGRDGFIKLWDVSVQECLSAHEVGSSGFVGMALFGEHSAAILDPTDMRSVLHLKLDARQKDVQMVHRWESKQSL